MYPPPPIRRDMPNYNKLEKLCDPPTAPYQPIITSATSRKLSKRRPVMHIIPQSDPIPQSSSEVAAALAAAQPLPDRTRSDPSPYTQTHDATTKRASLLRNFSLRSWRRQPESLASEVSSSSGRFSRWSRRRASTSDSSPQELAEQQDFLPLIRVVSPFAVSMPRKSSSPKRSFGDALGLPAEDNHKRAKFTLGSESDVDLPASAQFSDSPTQPEIAKRPRLLRRDAAGDNQSTVFRRRWTLAMAMTDEDITDEALMEELENMRALKTWGGSSDDVAQFWDVSEHIWNESGDPIFGSNGPTYDSETSKLPCTPSLPSFPLQHRLSTPAPAANASWQTARRALLTCRELVRTERHYLKSLRTLFASETENPPPPLMLRYLAGLVTVSEELLRRMQENPSAWGVAAAFLGTEESLEMAFSEWCGVVGGWFDDASPPTRKPSKQRVLEGEYSPLKRSASIWRKSLPSIANMDMSISVSSMSHPPPVFSGSFLGRKKTIVARKPAIRELAILPTQRVMRYVLLYRDLLAHTPSTSPSRALVERAAEAARRIAHKCDRAQGNSAFFIGTTAKKSSSPPVLEAPVNSSWRLLSAISLSL